MRALSATPVRLHVLEAYIETLKAENEILKRQLAAVETRAVQAKAEMATDTTNSPRSSYGLPLAGD